MRVRELLGTGGLAGAACAACCAPPLIAALGVTLGLAAVAGLVAGVAAAITVTVLGLGYLARRRRRTGPARCGAPTEPVAVAPPARRPG